MQFWCGVAVTNVWKWRRAFGVGKWEPEGSQRLHRRVSEAGEKKTRGRRRLRAQVDRSIATRRAKGFVVPNRCEKSGWTQKQLSLMVIRNVMLAYTSGIPRAIR